MENTTAPDIDRILQAIREEARARGARGTVGVYTSEVPAHRAVSVETHGMPALPISHVADFLALPLDVFLGSAYRHGLGREPDAAGAAYYQRALLRGRLSRVEVLGRLVFSAEGRKRGRRVPGLLIALALATLYRVPLAGPVLALIVRALGLPAHWRDRSAIEAAALATGTWLKR